jgi:hypothetical protein
MRYRLRTLLIVLAIGPPVLAGVYLFRELIVLLDLAPIVFVLAIAYVLVIIECFVRALQRRALCHDPIHDPRRAKPPSEPRSQSS